MLLRNVEKIHGLKYFENFITNAEKESMLEIIKSN
jgi:hypothetical protein